MKKIIDKKIGLFYGGKISRHLVMIREAAKREGVELDLISYNRICFETEAGEVKIRGRLSGDGEIGLDRYDVLFFRTTGKHWEEVDLINRQLRITNYGSRKRPVIVDPLVELGKPSMACKAWQMLALKEAGIGVPKTVYGSLWYLHQFMSDQLQVTNLDWQFPVILKGSGGDRGTRVFRANNLEELERLVRELRKSETEEGRRYMIQEWIENEGDYRVLVLGEKVLGVMKRSRRSEAEYRNNYSMGGKVEVVDLPEEIKELAVKAARACGLMVAGVDIMPKKRNTIYDLGFMNKKKKGNEKEGVGNMSHQPEDYVVLEVNKGPQFRGFMEATGVDVPREIVKFLVNLTK